VRSFHVPPPSHAPRLEGRSEAPESLTDTCACSVASVAECAQICIDTPYCTCAFYYGAGRCAWRVSSCESSELFIGATPTDAANGLIHICSAAPPPPAVGAPLARASEAAKRALPRHFVLR